MSEVHFSIKSTSQKVRIDPGEISAKGESDNPFLVVPIKFSFNKSGGDNSNEGSFVIQCIEARLLVNNIAIKMSEVVRFPYYEVYRSGIDYHTLLEFNLDAYKIEKIEQKREADLRMQVEFVLHLAYYESITFSNGGTKQFISGFGNTSDIVQFEIPQSQWVEKLLPNLGYKAFKLIEIPYFSDLLTEELKTCHDELEEASKYFHKGDYDKVVAHCRSAIDPIKKKLPELKEIINSNTEFNWIKKISEITYEWLDVLTKETTNLSSKTHHHPSIGHFSRFDSEIIFMVTTAIVSYAGRLQKQK